MSSYTTRYHMEKLNSGDPFSTDANKFTLGDRDIIDRVMEVGAETHHHTGVSASTDNPISAPGTALSTSGGTLAAGNTAYYEYTWVDANGFETAPSPFGSAAMPALVGSPSAPTLGFTAGGTLAAGTYLYVLSCYTGSSLNETITSLAATITTGATGSIVVTFPTLPTGATGYNIYRLSPGGTVYLYMVTVPVSGGVPANWTDNGSVGANCNRFPASSNTTNSTSSVVVTPPVSPPAGFTWNLYRSFNSGSWAGTRLATGLAGSNYTDVGAATASYGPPATSQLLSTPQKVLLTGGAEVQGLLPASMVSFGATYPFAVSFSFPGHVMGTLGSPTWVCPFASAVIVSAQCALGRGSTPASQPVIADVLKGSGVTPSYSSIYSGATPNPKPKVPVGQQIGSSAAPNVTSLALGDSLVVDIDQAGGGASPTDYDLTVVVYLKVATS